MKNIKEREDKEQSKANRIDDTSKYIESISNKILIQIKTLYNNKNNVNSNSNRFANTNNC